MLRYETIDIGTLAGAVPSGVDGVSADVTAVIPDVARAVHTFYENMFLEQGYKITYLAFTVNHDGPFVAPEDFDSDYWRSVEGPRLLFGHDSSETRRQKLSKASSKTEKDISKG